MELGFDWMQKLTFPLRDPKIVPVMVVAKDDDDDRLLCFLSSFSSSTKMQLHRGIRSCISERRNRHERTCFWQSTEVMGLVVVGYEVIMLMKMNNN